MYSSKLTQRAMRINKALLASIAILEVWIIGPSKATILVKIPAPTCHMAASAEIVGINDTEP